MSLDEADLAPAAGFVAPELREEFPGLRLDWVTAPRPPRPLGAGRSAAACCELSSRYRGASVVAMRTQPVPQAYRTFFRQIGLDPDTDRIPSEQVALDRLLVGGFRPRERIDDALRSP